MVQKCMPFEEPGSKCCFRDQMQEDGQIHWEDKVSPVSKVVSMEPHATQTQQITIFIFFRVPTLKPYIYISNFEGERNYSTMRTVSACGRFSIYGVILQALMTLVTWMNSTTLVKMTTGFENNVHIGCLIASKGAYMRADHLSTVKLKP